MLCCASVYPNIHYAVTDYDDKLLPDVTIITNDGNTNALSNTTLWTQFLSPSPALLANQQQYARSQDVVVPPYSNASTDNSSAIDVIN